MHIYCMSPISILYVAVTGENEHYSVFNLLSSPSAHTAQENGVLIAHIYKLL